MPTPFSVLEDGDDQIDLPPAPNASVGARTATSAIWLVASRLIAKGIDFTLLLVLARLLIPADFGLVAIGMTLVQIVEAVMELPLLQALVRMPMPEPGHYDTAFTLSLTRGLLLAASLSLLGVPFGYVYGDRRVMLIIAALSLAPAARGLLSPRLADFARAIDYRRDFAIEVGGKLVASIVATIVAVTKHSYWALVIGTVATPATMMVLSFLFAPYRPRLSLHDWRAFAGLLGWSTASQFVTAINWQMDRLLLGRFTTRTDLGLYSMANDLSYLPEQTIIKPVVRPLLSAFASYQHDPDILADAYVRTSAMVLAAGLPAILGLSVLAEPAARLVLGAKWLPAIPTLQLLALTTVPPLFVAGLGPLAIALNRNSIFFRQSLIELAVRLPLMSAAAVTAGINGVIAVRIASAVIMAVVSLWFVRQIAAIPIRRQLAASAPPMLAGGVLTLILLAMRPLTTHATGLELVMWLGVCAAIGTLGYVASLAALWSFILEAPAGNWMVASFLKNRMARRWSPR